MWIPLARPGGQRNTAFIGLDDGWRIWLAEQRLAGKQSPTAPWVTPQGLTASPYPTMEYGTGEDMAHTCSAQHIEQHGPAPSDSRPRRYSKAERQAFGALVNASAPADDCGGRRGPGLRRSR
jgi:hypothetical protein